MLMCNLTDQKLTEMCEKVAHVISALVWFIYLNFVLSSRRENFKHFFSLFTYLSNVNIAG